MALVVNATVGSATANSYITAAEFATYLEQRLHSTAAVTAAIADTINRAIVTATRLLDEHISWLEYVTSDSQALAWPRIGCYDILGNLIEEDEIPQKLKDAVAEFACQLIDGDRTADTGAGVSSLKVGEIALSFTEGEERKVIPDAVYEMVSQWDEDAGTSGTVKLVRA